MKQKKKNRALSLLLALVMVFSLLPVGAWAANADGASDAPSIASLNLYKDISREKSIPLSPAFSRDIHEYAIDLPDYLNSTVYAVGSATNKGDYLKTELRTPWGTSSKALLPTTISNLFKYDKIPFRVGPADNLNADNGDTLYTVAINKRLTLKNFVVNDTLQPSFNPDVTSYTAGIDKDATSFSVSLECFSFPCTVTINGIEVNWGGGLKSYDFPLTWNTEGKMPVEIKLSNGTVTSVYKLTLIKETAESTPVISVNPQSASYDDVDTAAPLTVKATANGALSYKWFRNTENSSSGGTEIAGATDASYTPEIPDVSEITKNYYYCEVTNTAEGGGSVVSAVAALTIYPDATPTVTCKTADGSALSEKYEYNVDDTPVGLKVQATSNVPGGVFLYSWKQGQKDSPANITNFSESNELMPDTSSDGESKYFCTVTYLVNGRSYSADSEQFPPVRVYESSAALPYISNQPSGAVYNVGETEVEELWVGAFPEGSKPGTITYQWLSSSDGKTFEPIDGAVSDSYTPPAMTESGTAYYKCSLTNTFTSISGKTYTSHADSAVAVIRFLDSYTDWTGKGTEAEPFQLASAQDLAKLRDYVNTGVSFDGYYFKMTGDITLPDGWVPIGALKSGAVNPSDGANIDPFSASFDGGDHTITIPKDGKAPFGYVRMASISNLKLFGEQVDGSALINNYAVDYGPTGSYSDVPAYVAKIDKVTLKEGSKTKASGLVDGNGSGMNNIYFTDCTVEPGVTVGYGKDQSNVGSFVSCLNGNMLRCVSSADVYGVNNVGGLAGIKGQSMGDCTIWDSAFRGTVTATGEFAGGIMGGGYNVNSAPNTPCVSIQNCYATGKVTGSDYVGGIFGGEGGVRECWENGIGYIQNNYFAGTLSAAKGGVSHVGGVIGYMQSLDRYNIISNNYYVENAGATKGIGDVGSIDKTEGRYSRSDDPVGADADKLSKPIAKESLSDETLLKLLNGGVNSAGTWKAGDSEPEVGSGKHILKITIDSIANNRMISNNIEDLKAKDITLWFSDRTTGTIKADQAQVSGFDTTTAGYKTVTVTFENHSYIFQLQVTNPSTPGGNPEENEISLTFRLVGSTLSSGDIDLGDGSYKGAKYVTWIPTKSYTLKAGSTMYDLFKEATAEAGISSEGADANYVKTIYAPTELGGYALSEFTNGYRSGWMYTVNGKHPDVGLKDYVLSNGENVVWHYVDDYSYEIDDWAADSGHPSLGDGTYYNLWLNAADVAPASDTGETTTPGSTDTTLAPPVTADNGKAEVAVKESDLKDVISSAKKSGEAIVIAPTIKGTVEKVSVELPKASVSAISSETKADLKVETGVGSITIPNEALASIAAQASDETVTVNLETVESSALSAEQQKAVGKDAVYDISILSGKNYISSFNGKNISIALPYTLKSGESAANVAVWYLNDAGKLERMSCSYDKSTGLASFTTPHLSKYVVGYENWVNPFTDVKTGDWFYDAVKFAAQKELFNGTSATSFAPDESMTRAMLVTVLYRMEGKPAVTGENSFTDVQAGQWYTDAVLWANANKLVEGYGNGSFGTNDSITREQMAAILYRYAQLKKYDVSKSAVLTKYSDAASVSAWASDAVKWANGEGLINGTTETTLAPRDTATRAQVAAILMRFAENIAK